MKTIQIFYQREGTPGVEHLELPTDSNLADVRRAILAKHGGGDEFNLFIEDGDEAAELSAAVTKHESAGSLKTHLHRCRRIEVTATFNNNTVEHAFPPSATVARIKRWAAEKQFGMTPEEAGEHVLQLSGSQERPAPGAHVGVLASHPTCHVAFDLVPNERVNGSYEPEVNSDGS